ncbi:MAG: Fur family transcriptional regulator [Acidimicrobiia bacterium]
MKTVAELTERFRNAGLRVTPQRQAVFGLLQGVESHPTVESLYYQVVAQMPTVSMRTVYQTVHDLADLGEVRLLDVGTGAVRVDPNVEQDHHHLVCSSCGGVRDLAVEFPGVALPRQYRAGFAVDAVEVVFRGTCGECQSAASS